MILEICMAVEMEILKLSHLLNWIRLWKQIQPVEKLPFIGTVNLWMLMVLARMIYR